MANKKYFTVFNNGVEDLYVKDEEAQDAMLHPVDISSLTPSTTFKKGDVLGINGVLYRCTADTSNRPITFQLSNNQFVTHTVNGKTAFVISDYTLNTGWEIWTDASIEYWVETMDTRLSAIEGALQGVLGGITVDGTTYTAAQVIQAIANFMGQTVVTKNT